jgi:arylsulfatase A-like enzyme
MTDQLRWDYLSCNGHPSLKTPNIDKLAKSGVNFKNAFVQSPMCGPSRACFYTGRTIFSNGVTWNRVPLPIGELTIDDYLKPKGIRTAVVGKTHMEADAEGMHRLGLNKGTEIGMVISEPGFEPYEKDDGLHPTPGYLHKNEALNYNKWLNSLGYEGVNPWNDYANSAEGDNGELLSGWSLRNSNLPARIKEEHSETPYMTMRAKEFIKETGDNPWCLHLSFIKPHWTFMAPAPYHNMYGKESFIPVSRHNSETENPNPVFKMFMEEQVGLTFSQQGTRETVLPGYMGLITQIDDHLGDLFNFLEKEGKKDETMIVFTSDHGDYLGDHWMGEKELFHDVSVKIPLIIFDPRKEADQSRGTECNELVEAIDLLPTFIEANELKVPNSRLEGKSLMSIINNNQTKPLRDHVFSEFDYGIYPVREKLSVDINDAKIFMIRDKNWKFIYYKGFDPQLFDLQNDPDEFFDLGKSQKHKNIIEKMKEKLFQRLINRRNRISISDEAYSIMRDDENEKGIIIGEW